MKKKNYQFERKKKLSSERSYRVIIPHICSILPSPNYTFILIIIEFINQTQVIVSEEVFLLLLFIKRH